MSEEKTPRVYKKRNIKRNDYIKSFCSTKEKGFELATAVDIMAKKYNLTSDAIYKILRSK